MFTTDNSKTLSVVGILAALASLGVGVARFNVGGAQLAIGHSLGYEAPSRPMQAAADEENNLQSAIPPPFIMKGTFLVFAPNGKSFAASSVDGSFALYDTLTKHEIRRFPSPPRSVVRDAAFSPDGKLLVPAWDPSTEPAPLFELGTGKELRRLEDCYWTGTALVFSPNSKVLVANVRVTKEVVNASHILRFWDVASGKRLTSLEIPLGDCFAVSACGNYILVGHSRILGEREHGQDIFDAQFWVKLYDLKTAKDLGQVGEKMEVRPRPGSSGLILQALLQNADFRGCVSPGGRALVVLQPRRFIARCSDETGIEIWDLGTNTRLARLEVFISPGPGDWGKLSADNCALVVQSRAAGGSRQLMLWDTTALVRRAMATPIQYRSKALNALWADLGHQDNAKAYEAQCRLFAVYDQALPMLKENLKPCATPTHAQIRQLLKLLDDNSFAKREQALGALRTCGDDAIPFLSDALKSTTLTPEARQRVKIILEEWKKTGLTGQTLQYLRAVELLERWASADSLRLLEALTKGTPDAWLTAEAQGALKRASAAKQAPSRAGFDRRPGSAWE